MSAVVKHISVHPKFRYHRRVGIFDDLDKKDAEERRKNEMKKKFSHRTHYHYSK